MSSADRPLDRMDAAPLQQAAGRWRQLVDQNFRVAEDLAQEAVAAARAAALRRLDLRLDERQRDLKRSHTRELALLPASGPARAAAIDRHVEDLVQVQREKERLSRAISHATPRLVAAMAVRLLRARDASA
jgi:hypothetical protein